MNILKKIENYFQSEDQKRQNKEIRLRLEKIEKRLSRLESCGEKQNYYWEKPLNEILKKRYDGHFTIIKEITLPLMAEQINPAEIIAKAKAAFAETDQTPAPIPEQIKPKRKSGSGRKTGSRLDESKIGILNYYRHSQKSIPEICQKYGVSRQGLYVWLRKNGVELRNKRTK